RVFRFLFQTGLKYFASLGEPGFGAVLVVFGTGNDRFVPGAREIETEVGFLKISSWRRGQDFVCGRVVTPVHRQHDAQRSLGSADIEIGRRIRERFSENGNITAGGELNNAFAYENDRRLQTG